MQEQETVLTEKEDKETQLEERRIERLAQDFSMRKEYVRNVVTLLGEGCTIPFIARYRKEQHGACDDQVLRELEERLNYLRGLDKRRAEVRSSIAEQGKLTRELDLELEQAETLARLEDLYRPYKQKRRTRATVAMEKGLGPLAETLWAGEVAEGTPELLAEAYVDPEKGVADVQDALAGASDIMAEMVSDDAGGRELLRRYYEKNGVIQSALREGKEDPLYEMYYNYREPLGKIPSHRILAINRGEKEEVLRVSLEVEENYAIGLLWGRFVKKDQSVSKELVKSAIADGYKRLLHPSLERELRSALTEKAQKQAITVFGLNLKALLLQPPIKGKRVMAIDPAYRTGCKIAVVDETGKVLETGVVYPTPPQNKTREAKRILSEMIRRHGVQVLSIGNGTASRESELFAGELIREMGGDLSYAITNEAGASVYSASKLGAQEFPDFDVTQRSAVSIARRMQDPLAELVKIDPKSIGVGQYQHDMPQKQLDETLRGVVEDCVNKVGVDLNTASVALLSYVSGISSAVAGNIQKYREENGAFTARSQLKKVPKLGPKAYTQCAGFLRIPGGKNLLDNTGVHPESYDAAKKLLERFGYTLSDAAKGGLGELRQKVQEEGAEAMAEYCGVGEHTLMDVIGELEKPGRDMRDELPPPMLRQDVMEMKDLQPGMELKGAVRNVVDFGVFIDIGVHQDGLLHISRFGQRVSHPSQRFSVGDVVTVWVESVDLSKKRIALTMVRRKENGS